MRIGDTYRIPVVAEWHPGQDEVIVRELREVTVEMLAAGAFDFQIASDGGTGYVEEQLAQALLDRGMVAVSEPRWRTKELSEYAPSKFYEVSVLCIRWPEDL